MLDLQHTWVTGVPIHFAVIYLGYLVALWLWNRRGTASAGDSSSAVSTTATRALLTGLGIVVVGGGLEALAIGEFPGGTWFLVRLLITVPFVLAWWAAAGDDRGAAVGGALTLGFILATYSHFLGPVGLPDPDLRVWAQNPPPATVHWLSYPQEWLVAFPITTLVALAALLLAGARTHGRALPRVRPGAAVATGTIVLTIAALGVVAAAATGPGDERVTVTGTGEPVVEDGPFFTGELAAGKAELQLSAEPRNPRVTPLPPHDVVEVRASVEHPDGTRYEISADRPLVDDPLGRHGTWWGVGIDRWHHGRSGIGTSALPPIRSDVAVFALGEVRSDGRVVATGVPVHVMTLHTGGVELHVGDPDVPVPGLPDGHLRAVWPDREDTSSEAPERARSALGGAVLLALIALALLAVRAGSPSSGGAHRAMRPPQRA